MKDLKKISKVKTEIFDNEFNNRRIDFCKIDVRGEEINVLKGMKKNLKKKYQIIKNRVLLSKDMLV